MESIRIDANRDGCKLGLRVLPGGSRDSIEGAFDGRLRVRVRAAPERGKANRAVIRLLGRCLGIPLSSLEIVAGHGSRDKVLLVHGLDPDQLSAKLRELSPKNGDPLIVSPGGVI